MSSWHIEMSAANEEAVSDAALQAGMDGRTATHQDAVDVEEMLQDSETVTVTVAETGSNNDQLSVGADVVSEPEVSNVSSETSNSSQGPHDFHCCSSVMYIFKILY